MEENLETHTIFKVDILKGKSSINTDGLANLLLEYFDHRLNDDPTTHLYEDSFCPDSPIVDSIVDELKDKFYQHTGGFIELQKKWSQIHKPQMSTNRHHHYPADVAAVYYVSIPKGSGQLCFYHEYNKFNPYVIKYKPEEKTFLFFPGVLEHSVSRNLSNTDRISLSFNFKLNDNKK